jgi:hypothetical protein
VTAGPGAGGDGPGAAQYWPPEAVQTLWLALVHGTDHDGLHKHWAEALQQPHPEQIGLELCGAHVAAPPRKLRSKSAMTEVAITKHMKAFLNALAMMHRSALHNFPKAITCLR